jgi:paraquat-inducible protein A
MSKNRNLLRLLTGGTHPRSLAAGARGMDRLLGPAFALAALLLCAGWVLPIMTIDRLFFLEERVSLVEGILELFQEGHVFLGVLLGAFSIVFPAAKILIALYLWQSTDADHGKLSGILSWLERLGRWSMLDVFIVALLVVAIQVSLISDVATHLGFYLFTVGVVLSLILVRRLKDLAERKIKERRATFAPHKKHLPANGHED